MKLIFVTGKGGVGKSCFAASMALKKAKENKKVLLVEFGPNSYFQNIFKLSSSEPSENLITANSNLDVVMWKFEDVLVEFITYYLKLKPLVKTFFASSIMKRLIKVAPSLRELVYLGKATSPYRNIGKKMNYDYVIIDSYSTGHFLALLRSPRGMMKAISKGAMHEQCKTILSVMQDKSKTEYYVVSLAEKLPIIETNEFTETLKLEFGLEPTIILNKVRESLDGELNINCEFQSYYSRLVKNQNQNLARLNTVTKPQMIPFVYKNHTSDVVLDMLTDVD